MFAPASLAWADGKLAASGEVRVGSDDSAFREARGCYTTARVSSGRVRYAERHVQRLVRDARRIALGELDPALCHRAFRELAHAAFPAGTGIVRLQASRDGAGALRLVGATRGLGPDPAHWSAITAPLPHEGVSPFAGAKVTSRLRLALAYDAACAAGTEEALLLDADGWLVEGAHTSLFVAAADGSLATPPLARGGVDGIARAIVLEGIAGVRERDVSASALGEAREIVAVNAVRGARPILRLDGRAIGDGHPGPWATRLASVLDSD